MTTTFRTFGVAASAGGATHRSAQVAAHRPAPVLPQIIARQNEPARQTIQKIGR